MLGLTLSALMFCLIGMLIIGSITGLIIFLIKIGVIFQKASEQPHIDHGNYTIDAGQEVRAERDR